MKAYYILLKIDGSQEVQPHSKWAELDGDRSGGGASSYHWEWKLTARKKASLLAIHGKKIRLGQNLQHAPLLQIRNRCCQI